jgi:hypothetical protein
MRLVRASNPVGARPLLPSAAVCRRTASDRALEPQSDVIPLPCAAVCRFHNASTPSLGAWRSGGASEVNHAPIARGPASALHGGCRAKDPDSPAGSAVGAIVAGHHHTRRLSHGGPLREPRDMMASHDQSMHGRLGWFVQQPPSKGAALYSRSPTASSASSWGQASRPPIRALPRGGGHRAQVSDGQYGVRIGGLGVRPRQTPAPDRSQAGR